MHFNPNPSVLATLSEEQQQQLLTWLDLHSIGEVLQKVAAPPPDGFGLQTHPNSLKRFYARHRVLAFKENSELAVEMLSAAVHASDFDRATASGLRQIAFELTNTPGVGAKQFKALSRWILKLRDQEQQTAALALARERLALDREKFQFNAARQALLHQAELGKIMQNTESDNEDKINAARAALFGESLSTSSASSAHREAGKSKLVPMSPLP